MSVKTCYHVSTNVQDVYWKEKQSYIKHTQYKVEINILVIRTISNTNTNNYTKYVQPR